MSGSTEQPSAAVGLRHPWLTTYQWELEKLTAQFRTRLAVAAAMVAPALFAIGLRFATDVPADTLFGRWVGDSGYALPLVVLGFAGSWGFPLLVSLVAGDIFSAEDHYRTWTTILTRAASRGAVFAGKVLAALTYSVVVVLLLALSSVLSGLVSVGHQPLIGVSGNLIGADRAPWLVLGSWASVIPAALSFAGLAVLVSIATRHSLAGILAPAVLGGLLQVVLLVGGVVDPIRPFLLGASFQAWVGNFASPAFDRPMIIGIACSAGYLAVCLTAGWLVFSRRDVSGA